MFWGRAGLLGLVAVMGACAGRGEVRIAPVVAVDVVAVAATPTRQATMTIYAPTQVKGVILFSHGGSGDHHGYPALFARLNAAGYAIVAPLHVDSRAHPDTARYTIMSAFPERIADLAAAARLAGERYPGRPVAAMGHSYGSLFAQMTGGALAAMNARIAGVKAVVSFSSPGVIQGLIDPAASFAQMNVPTLMVTGTADLVPGFVSDPAAHLASHRGAPAGHHYALVLDGADHFLAANRAADPAQFAQALDATVAFLDAWVLDDAAAQRRLERIAGLDRR